LFWAIIVNLEEIPDVREKKCHHLYALTLLVWCCCYTAILPEPIIRLLLIHSYETGIKVDYKVKQYI